jgi:hypothetical protein
VGIHDFENSIVERFSVLKAIFMVGIEAVDVIAIPGAVVAEVDICMVGKGNGNISSQTSMNATKGVLTVDQKRITRQARPEEDKRLAERRQIAEIGPPGTQKSLTPVHVALGKKSS